MSQSLAPYALRGNFYPSALYRRCNEYHYCRRCHMCANFNVHSAQCQQCEDRKPSYMRCQCTLEQRHLLIQLEKKIDRPMVDRNQTEGSEVLFQTNHNQQAQELVQQLRASENGDRE